jgi:hypothetical protein
VIHEILYDKLTTKIDDNNYYLKTFSPNIHLLNNWKLIIVDPGLINSYIYDGILLVVSSIVLSIVIYAYIIPRNWLDDYDQKIIIKVQ